MRRKTRSRRVRQGSIPLINYVLIFVNFLFLYGLLQAKACTNVPLLLLGLVEELDGSR
jgi:hypothetical protein